MQDPFEITLTATADEKIAAMRTLIGHQATEIVLLKALIAAHPDVFPLLAPPSGAAPVPTDAPDDQ